MIEDATSFRSKEQVMFDLCKALQFSPESVEANRKGILSPEQSKKLTGKCVQPAALMVLWAVAPFLGWAGMTGIQQQLPFPTALATLLAQLGNPSQLMEAHGRMGAIAIGVSFLICLGAAAYMASRVSLGLCFDLLDRKVVKKEGRVVAREDQTLRPNGRDPIEKYYFNLKQDMFEVNLAAFRALESGSVYLVYTLPRSEIMVALEPKVFR